MAVTAKISSGFKWGVDPAGTTTYQDIFAHVDFSVSQRAPRQEKTKQLSGGKREFIPGLRERELTFSLRWDQSDAQVGRTHAELYGDFMAATKMRWLLTYPPNAAGSYTGARTRSFLGVLTGFQVRGALGEVITADVTLQICLAVTESTAA